MIPSEQCAILSRDLDYINVRTNNHWVTNQKPDVLFLCVTEISEHLLVLSIVAYH